jgi:hypothetical protein
MKGLTMRDILNVHPKDPFSTGDLLRLRFEADRVDMILRRFKLCESRRLLYDDCQAQHGHWRLTFESFFRVFPNFPMVLETEWRSGVAEILTPAALFRSFEELFFLDKYLEVYTRAKVASDRPVGLVIPFGGYRGGMVIHNGDFDIRGTRLFHDFEVDVPPHQVYVDPFDTLLKFLSRGDFTPTSGMHHRASTTKSRVRREMIVDRSLVERLGPGPALLVFAWMRGVLHSASGYHRRFVRHFDGERCVAATHEQIAFQTGLSTRQVRRGLASLRKMGLIVTRQREGRSCIWLAVDDSFDDGDVEGE